MSDLQITASLNGVLLDGCSDEADFIILNDSIQGLGFGDTRVVDQERSGYPGSVAGEDFQQTRVITIPVACYAPEDPRAAMELFRQLKAAWQPSDQEEVLTVTISGLAPTTDALDFYGRPRGTLEPSLNRLAGGIVYARCVFAALDPVGYGPAVNDGGSGTFTVNNPGDHWTDRAELTITGNGGTPSLLNNDDGGGSVGWAAPLANGVERTVNLRTFQVTDNANVDRTSEIASASSWFVLYPGDNELVLSGAASVAATIRPGYL